MDECAYTKKIDVHCARGLPIFSYAAKKTRNTNTYTQISEEKHISSLGSYNWYVRQNKNILLYICYSFSCYHIEMLTNSAKPIYIFTRNAFGTHNFTHF